jgi:hypothetical protein
LIGLILTQNVTNILVTKACSAFYFVQATLAKFGPRMGNMNLKQTKLATNNYTSSSSIGTTTLIWVSACSTIVEHSQ